MNVSRPGTIRHVLNKTGNTLLADKTVKYDPSKSVLRLRIGGVIRLKQSDFVHLSEAFLSEIERKFG